MNRWRSKERAQGGAAQRRMNAHYAKGSIVNAYYMVGFICPIKL